MVFDFLKRIEDTAQGFMDLTAAFPFQTPNSSAPTQDLSATLQCLDYFATSGQLPFTTDQMANCVENTKFNTSLFGSFGANENRFSSGMRMYGGELTDLISGQMTLDLTESRKPVSLYEFSGTLKEYPPVNRWLAAHPQWTEQDLIDFNLALGAGANDQGVVLLLPSDKATKVLSSNLSGNTLDPDKFLQEAESFMKFEKAFKEQIKLLKSIEPQGRPKSPDDEKFQLSIKRPNWKIPDQPNATYNTLNQEFQIQIPMNKQVK